MAEAEEFGALLQNIRRMQAGTKALVRCAGRELAICQCALSEDLDTVALVPCEPAKDSALVVNVNSDIEAVEPPQGGEEVSVVMRMAQGGVLELVFATDSDCELWHVGLSFLKGNAPPAQAAKAEATEVKEDWVDLTSLEARNKELVELVRQKDATIAQLLKEAKEGKYEGPGHVQSLESDAHMKDRLIAQLRAQNEALRAQLEKKDRAVRNLVQALRDLQPEEESESEEEAPFRPPSRGSLPPAGTHAPRNTVVVEQAEAEGQRSQEEELEQLQGFIGTLTTKFDGLEQELQQKSAMLQELYNEEKAAKEEHASLLEQLQELESQGHKVEYAPGGEAYVEEEEEEEDVTPDALRGMQDKVQALEAMLAKLSGAPEEAPPQRASPQRTSPPRATPRSPPRAQTAAPDAALQEMLLRLQGNQATEASRATQAMQAMQAVMAGMQNGPPAGDIAGNLADLEAKKRQIEELAKVLNISLSES